MRLKSFVLSLAMLATVILQATPAPAAWAQEVPLSIQVIGYFPSGASQTLGRVDGVVQFNDDGNSLRYTLTFCRQSSYQLPYLQINVNSSWIGGRKYYTWITNVYPPYSGYSNSQPCYGQTGTVSSEFTSANFWNVEFILYGSTFIGQSHTIFTQDRVFNNPY
jgi:hypothetical protein